MLEGLAIWFLNNYLGKYLENLDPEQLSISLLSGQVELENVPLRKDALSFLNGVELKKGLVGNIRLTIPVSSLGTDPWCLSLQGVNIIVGPKRKTSRKQRLEPNVRFIEKESEVEVEEEEEEEEEVEEIIEKEPPAPTGWLNYGRLNIRTIVENLQLEVKDINIRYEDSVTTVGVAVESLTGLDISIDFQVTRFLAQQFFPAPPIIESRRNNCRVVSRLDNKVEHFSLAHNVTMMLSQFLPYSRS